MTLPLPPLQPLRQVAARLDALGLVWAIGGSGLLRGLGIPVAVRDWDLTTEASQDEVHGALRDLAPTLHGNLGIHADHKVVCFDGTVEVICRFAFHGGGGVIHIPTLVTRTWNELPLGSPEAWAAAYTLMIGEKPDRAAKAEALFTWLRAHGHDPGALAALLAQPLPAPLAARLRALES